MLKEKEQTKVALLAVFSVFTLSACGGGGSDSDKPTASKLTPGVFDIGRVLSGGTNEGDSLLSPTGKFVAVFSSEGRNSYTFGDLEFSDSGKVSGQVTEYIWDSSSWGITEGSLSGQVISSRRADLTASKDSPVSDSILYRKPGSSNLGITLAEISTTYTDTDNALVVTISPDGSVDGRSGTQCAFLGEIVIRDTTANVFEINYEAFDCPSNGDFTGLGTYIHADDPSDGELNFFTHNDEIAWEFKGKR